MLALLPLMSSAYAGDIPVFFVGDPEVAIRQVALETGSPIWQLDLLRPAEVVEGDGPRAIGAGQHATMCATESTNLALREYLDKVEGRVTYEQWGEARNDLDAALAALSCLVEPAESSLGARLFFLRGITLTALGETAGGQAAFVRALHFHPGLKWDESFTPDWKPNFEAAQADVSKRPLGRLVVGPGLEGNSSLWVDGRMANLGDGSVQVPEGEHLVQVLSPHVTTMEVITHGGANVAILVPAAIPDDVASNLLDRRTQAILDAIVAETSGGGPAYAWTGERTWKSDGTTWTELPAHEVDEGPSMRAEVGRGLFWSGLGASAVGLVSTGMGLAMWAPNHVPATGEVGAAYADRVDRAARGGGIATAGLVSFGLGVVAIGVSIPIGKEPVAVGVAPSATGNGAVVALGGSW